MIEKHKRCSQESMHNVQYFSFGMIYGRKIKLVDIDTCGGFDVVSHVRYNARVIY